MICMHVKMVSNALTVKSIIRGYHVYKTVWNPEINDKFDACIDQYNERDRYAMKIKIGDETVGHVPIELSKLFIILSRTQAQSKEKLWESDKDRLLLEKANVNGIAEIRRMCRI